MKKAVPDDVYVIGMDDGDGGDICWMVPSYTDSDVEGWVAGE